MDYNGENAGEKETVQRCLMHIVHSYTAILFRQLSEYELYPGQIPVIMIVENHDGLSQSEICQKLHIKASTVAVSMKRMEKKGLICRKADDKDQRITRVYATDQLHMMHDRIKALVKEDEELMLKGFTEEEVCLLDGLLNRLLGNLEVFQPSCCRSDRKERMRSNKL
ncbi:MAG: MarR family transcriptional regulator [Lachnospiraceae bacterium]|nr:MarR family transcriptional regulator [Lachnospiraceae bacterium]